MTTTPNHLTLMHILNFVFVGDPTHPTPFLISSIILPSLIRSLAIPTTIAIVLFFPFIDCTHQPVLLIVLSVVTFFVCFYVNNWLMRRYSTKNVCVVCMISNGIHL
ncbi:hypothetical protein AAZV13_13G312200 [Glycine max]